MITDNQMRSDLQIESLAEADLGQIDPFVAKLVRLETEQQVAKLILVASVSAAPKAVPQALGSVFQNVVAEGYPATQMTHEPEERLQDLTSQSAFHRRYIYAQQDTLRPARRGHHDHR